ESLAPDPETVTHMGNGTALVHPNDGAVIHLSVGSCTDDMGDFLKALRLAPGDVALMEDAFGKGIRLR
ncbi:MAG: hypothetical protein ACR2PF_14585, partial [Rhizobiaceae bacterium]